METKEIKPSPPHPLNSEDQKILADLCSPDSETNFVFDPKQSPANILRSLYVATRAATWLERRRDGLIQVIGRILSVCKNNPDIYQTLGYKSFDAFIKKHVVEALGMSKSTLRDAMGIYEAFPDKPPSLIAEIGVTKMNLIRRHTNSDQPGHMAILEAAKTQSYREVLKAICERENVPSGEIDRAVIVIQCTVAQKEMFESFADDPRVRSMCQTEDWGLILENMIAEVGAEWLQDVAVAG
jgi:hypothetical protein